MHNCYPQTLAISRWKIKKEHSRHIFAIVLSLYKLINNYLTYRSLQTYRQCQNWFTKFPLLLKIVLVEESKNFLKRLEK